MQHFNSMALLGGGGETEKRSNGKEPSLEAACPSLLFQSLNQREGSYRNIFEKIKFQIQLF